MALKLRRVVTGHDKSGKAVVVIDEQVKNAVSARPRRERERRLVHREFSGRQ